MFVLSRSALTWADLCRLSKSLACGKCTIHPQNDNHVSCIIKIIGTCINLYLAIVCDGSGYLAGCSVLFIHGWHQISGYSFTDEYYMIFAFGLFNFLGSCKNNKYVQRIQIHQSKMVRIIPKVLPYLHNIKFHLQYSPICADSQRFGQTTSRSI